MRITDPYFSWWLRPGKVRSLEVGGLNRSYVVHVPDRGDLQKPMPVVLALHGATMNGPMMAWFSGLNQTADAAGFIAVYPNGTGTRSSYFWNGGKCLGTALQTDVDDVAFVDALLDDLMREFPVDAQRVYATGMSNGGVMAYRLAAELGERIAAIAPVAGSVGTEIGHPQRAVSVLHFHGTEDDFVPFTGGRGKKSITGTSFRSVDQSIQTWVTANGCQPTPHTAVLAAGEDGMKVTRRTYDLGRNGSQVVLVVIDGGGHTWPGKASPAKNLGKSTTSISANELMWEFFQRHPLG